MKEVQSLNGKLVTLGRFLANSVDQTLPFFQTLKTFIGKKDILWLDEAEEALQKLKRFLKQLSTLASPLKEEVLTVYLSVSHEAISATLVAGRGTKQVPIYFISRVLQGAKQNYSKVENLVLSLVYTAR